jgi:hypothetical protein
MKRLVSVLLPAALALPCIAQLPCGGVSGVTATVTPSVAAVGQSVTVTLDNQSNQTIMLPSSCTYGSVHPDSSCNASPVFAPFCLSVLVPIAPGQSSSMTWDQTDDNGAQVPAGSYSFQVSYWDANFTALHTCCVQLSIAQPTPYCTAGTTTNGCNASMSASGTPTAGAPSGFVLTCSNVEGQKSGLLFYGISGQLAQPWGLGSTSFLCVKAPTQRTNLQGSGGTNGACDGVIALDFLTYLATNPGALGAPGTAGQVFDAQVWFRDPPAPKTTNLSDAIEFMLVP